MSKRGPDAQARLVSALRALVEGPESAMAIERSRSEAWQSVTLSGARHHLQLRLDGEGAEAGADHLLRRLKREHWSDPDLPIGGHLIADLAARRLPGDPVRIEIEALTVADPVVTQPTIH